MSETPSTMISSFSAAAGVGSEFASDFRRCANHGRSTLSAFLLPCALTSTSELMSHRESEALGMVWFDIATAGSSHSVPNGDHRLEDNLRDRSGVERLHQPGEPAHPTVLWVMLGAREHVKSPVERRAWTCNPPCSLTAVLDCASVHRSEVMCALLCTSLPNPCSGERPAQFEEVVAAATAHQAPHDASALVWPPTNESGLAL